jgi:hypothetical protein
LKPLARPCCHIIIQVQRDLLWMAMNLCNGLEPVLEVFDLPAPYRPFNPVFLGLLSGDDFTNSSTRQEPTAATDRGQPKAVTQRFTVSGASIG